ncbi:MAG: SemiSWEET family sugar transporter [Burkholderiales bacterium]
MAGLGTTFAALPDLIAMLKRRSSKGMNPRMAAIMGAFQILWVYYGLLIASRPVILWYIVAVATNFISVGAYLHYARRDACAAVQLVGWHLPSYRRRMGQRSRQACTATTCGQRLVCLNLTHKSQAATQICVVRKNFHNDSKDSHSHIFCRTLNVGSEILKFEVRSASRPGNRPACRPTGEDNSLCRS